MVECFASAAIAVVAVAVGFRADFTMFLAGWLQQYALHWSAAKNVVKWQKTLKKKPIMERIQKQLEAASAVSDVARELFL